METAHEIELHDGEELTENSKIPEHVPDDDDDFWKRLDELKNPYVADPSFEEKRLKKETPKHRAAFLYWCRLHPAYRTDKAVADKYKVSAAMVGKWRKSFNWTRRLEVLMEEDAERQLAVAKRTITDDLNLILGASKEAVDLFLSDVREGRVELTAKDFVQVCEMMLRIRKEIEGSPISGNGGEMSALDRIAATMNQIGEGSKEVLVRSLLVQITGDNKIPADRLVEARAARVIQEDIEANEIGEEPDDVEFNDTTNWENASTAEGD